MTREEIGKVLKELRQSVYLSQKEAAEAIGKKQQTIAAWENGTTQPDINTFFKLCELYNATPDEAFHIKPRKVLTAKEWEAVSKYRELDEYGKSVVRFLLAEESRRTAQQRKEKANIYYSVPYAYDLPASAGTGEISMDIAHFYLAGITEKPPASADFMVRVQGDSMEPEYKSGEYVFIKRADVIDNGKTGLFYLDGNVYIKKLEDNFLVSINPEYEPIEIKDFSMAKCYGIAVGKYSGDIFEL